MRSNDWKYHLAFRGEHRSKTPLRLILLKYVESSATKRIKVTSIYMRQLICIMSQSTKIATGIS
jgi:hypothetical protein